MTHKKTIKRDNGLQYQICVNVYLDSYGNKGVEYRIDIYCRKKGKRNWLNVEKGIDSYKYRGLSMEERSEYDIKNNLRYLTQDEIHEAKLELWNKLKPES